MNIKTTKRMGRPATAQLTKLKDGYYIEIRSKGSNSGIKIRRETIVAMQQAVKDYTKTMDVVVLGEYKDGKWLNHTK